MWCIGGTFLNGTVCYLWFDRGTALHTFYKRSREQRKKARAHTIAICLLVISSVDTDKTKPTEKKGTISELVGCCCCFLLFFVVIIVCRLSNRLAVFQLMCTMSRICFSFSTPNATDPHNIGELNRWNRQTFTAIYILLLEFENVQTWCHNGLRSIGIKPRWKHWKKVTRSTDKKHVNRDHISTFLLLIVKEISNQ